MNEKINLTNTMQQQSMERILDPKDKGILLSTICNVSPYAILKRKKQSILSDTKKKKVSPKAQMKS